MICYIDFGNSKKFHQLLLRFYLLKSKNVNTTLNQLMLVRLKDVTLLGFLSRNPLRRWEILVPKLYECLLINLKNSFQIYSDRIYNPILNLWKSIRGCNIWNGFQILNQNQNSLFISHIRVIRESSLTTKLRVVVLTDQVVPDTGIFLNDILHTEAKLQVDLHNVLIWFRQFCYVFSSDVEKMYRQIKVHKKDLDF